MLSFPAGAKDVADEVNPFIATGNLGHTFPGATMPFGMVQPSPDTRLKGWGSCAGYVYSDKVIFGFCQTRMSGVGIPDLGDILLLPATGPIKWKTGYLGTSEDAPDFDPAGYGSHFQKSSEKASPGYYAVNLDDYGVQVELTATTRVAVHRYTFKQGGDNHILLNVAHHNGVIASSLRIVDDRTVVGMRQSRAWAKDRPIYFAATFSRPVEALIAVDDVEKPGLKEATGRNLKAALRFKGKPGEQVLVKIAVSAVDIEGAQKNLAGLAGFDFDQVRTAAHKAWNRELAKVEIKGGTADERTMFYTGLYHAFLQPNTFQDVDGRYLGRDLKVHQAGGWTQHTIFSLWDTYRAAHPLYTLLQPAKDLDFVRTFLAEYRDGGRLPVWGLWANETDCMIGYHSVPVIVDAWMKGIRDFDPNLALTAMKHSAEENGHGLRAYRELGYIPADAEPENVSKTLEYAYDDWCIAQFAKSIGNDDDYRTYIRRAQSWQHMMDTNGFFHPRGNGMFLEPFRLNAVTFHFTEATPWQYAFAVPQDLDGFMKRLGGGDALERQLDGLFAASPKIDGWEEEDITGLVGQYAHGNEPSHHIAYLYDYAGKPWKTQARVRSLMSELHFNKPDGMPGNEDCGQMSSWYVFSALGFYPVCPGSTDYAIGSPLFDKATLHLDNGKSLVIETRGNGAKRPYIQSATLDGKPFTASHLTHAQILQGGKLVFAMGDKPSAWGSSEKDRPHTGIADEPVVPAPTACGEAVFQTQTTVGLKAANASDRIYFTLDGSQPSETSAVFSTPIDIQKDTTLRFRASRAGAWSPVVESHFHRLSDWPKLKLESTIHPTFYASGPLALIDGITGGQNSRSENWQGFYGEDLKATLDLGEVRDLHRVSTRFLQNAYTWTYFPVEVRFEVSENGQIWKTAGTVVTPSELKQYGPHLSDGKLEDHDYSIETTLRARYVRLLAKSPITIPKGSWREGSTCFICADEIVVK